MNNDIEVVIKIPKSMKDMCEWHRDGICDLVNIEIEILAEAIKNGTVLPKGHDDLIDKKNLIKAMEQKAKRLDNLDTINGLCGAVALVFEAETIIAADKENEE